MSEKLIGQAKRVMLGNDIFWEFSAFDENMNWVSLGWTGYNDSAWWSKYSKDCDTCCSNGKTYRIDFSNCNVYEIVEEKR